MSKGQIINELCGLCDTITEQAIKNQRIFDHLIQKYPQSSILRSFQPISYDTFEDQTIAKLRRYDQYQLNKFNQEAMLCFDLMINQEAQLEKLRIKLQQNKTHDDKKITIKPSPQNVESAKDSWKFLIATNLNEKKSEQKIEDRMDVLIKTVLFMKNNMSTENKKAQESTSKILQSSGRLTINNEYQEKYEQQVLQNKSLEAQILQLKDRIQQQEFQKVEEKKQSLQEPQQILLETSEYKLIMINKSIAFENVNYTTLMSQLEREILKNKMDIDCKALQDHKENMNNNDQRLQISDVRMKKIEELERKIQDLEYQKDKDKSVSLNFEINYLP